MNQHKSQGSFKSEALRFDATTQKDLRDLYLVHE